MTDTILLGDKIELSGISKTAIAQKLNIKRETLYNKLNGKTQFNISEMLELTNILNLSEEEREQIFFAPNREYNSHN